MSEAKREEGIEARIERSLSLSWKEGIAAQLMLTIVDYYLVPFALLLGASNVEVGFLVAFPNLLSSISQLAAVRAVDWAGDRLRLLLRGVAVQALVLMPVGLLSYLHAPIGIVLLVAATCVFKTAGTLIGPAWGSLVSEYLPPERRGEYFGWRAQVIGIAGLLGLCFCGWFLAFWERVAGASSGFLLLFAGAGAFRLVSYRYMSRMVDLPFRRGSESDFTFWMFVRRFRESNFVKFVLYVATITFATQVAAPFFTVHMLRDLKLSYLSYTTVHLAAILGGLVAFPVWGRHADEIGNARILKTTSLLIPLLPVLWVFPRSPFWLVLLEVFSGFVWGGFNLCAANFIYDAVVPSKRVRCLGYFNLVNGAALFAGATLGGALATRLPHVLGYPLLGLFLLSGTARLLAHFLLSRHFQEVRRDTRAVTSMELFFSVVGVRPILGRNVEILSLTRRSWRRGPPVK